jgi:peptide/nickel transport system substrate-binding protein
MFRKRGAILLSIMLLFGTVLAACSNSSSSPGNSGGGNNGEARNTEENLTTPASNEPRELTIALDQDPVGFDPHLVPALSSKRVYNLVYDTLTKMDPDMNVVPNLAREWTFAPDGKTVTFKLHEGVKFHNGRAMTSEDVKYSFERILNPDTGALAASFFTSVESIETPDATTVVFRLKNPDSALLANVASPYTAIVPKEVADLNTEMVGTGPFKVVSVDSTTIKLEKNPEYFMPEYPKVDIVTFRIMKDEAERLAAIRTGRIDLTTVSADSAELLKIDGSLSIKSYQSMDYGYLGINVNKKPFDDVRVRQAISYAVDRRAIVDVVWKGEAELTGPISPAQKAYAIDLTGLIGYQRDVEKARQLLAEAGYGNGFKTVIQTASTYPDMLDSALIIQQQLKEIGIDAEVEQLEWAKYIEVWKSKDMTLLVGRNTAGNDPDRSLRFFFSTKGGANVWNYSNPQFDALVQQALETTDLEQRKSLYAEAQKMVISDAPNLFLASPRYFYAVSDRVEGFEPSATEESYAIMRTSVK